MAGKFDLKPLSSGLGLGSLRATNSKRPTVPASQRFEITPDMISPASELPPITHIGRDIYQKQSVGVAMKSAPRARFIVWFVRSVVGWGLDVLVVGVTLILCAVLAAVAWRLGAGTQHGLDVFAAVSNVVNTAIRVGPRGLGIVFAGALFVYWAVMRFIAGTTIGGSIRRPN